MDGHGMRRHLPCPVLGDRHWGELTAGHPWGSMGQQRYGTATPGWLWVAVPPQSPPRALTRDGDRGVAVLLQHGVEHQARVGDTGLHQHVQDTVHLEEPLLVGHLRRGDVGGQVGTPAVLPQHAGLRVAVGRVARHHSHVTRLQVLAGLQVHAGLGVGS